MAAIKFGTDGWRAIIGADYTFDNVAKVAQAYAEYLKQTGGKRVAVGFDTRFQAGKFAQKAAEILAANGLEVLISKTYVPTPVLSYAVKHLGCDGGVMITASHNPAEYLGFKIKGSFGGAATPSIISAVEQFIGAEPATFDASIHKIGSFDVKKEYFDFLASQLDMDALKAYKGVMYHESMGGAGCGWLAAFVKQNKLAVELRELHAVPDCMFYGVNPEPIPQNQYTAMTVLKAEEGNTFCAVNDGDADRIGAITAGGANFNSHQIFAVFLKTLASKGLTGRVIKTFSVTKIIELLAEKLGLEVMTTPIGFKYVTDEMLKGDVLIGGEESGGIGVMGHIPERDGIFNALMLLESVAKTGKSLEAQFAEIEELVGYQHNYDRLDLKLPSMEAMAKVIESVKTPRVIAGRKVVSTETLDGVKWWFEDNGWLLFRPSGTEPVLRVYCELPVQGVEAVLAEARMIAGV